MELAPHQLSCCKSPVAYFAVAFALGILTANSVAFPFASVLIFSASVFVISLLTTRKDFLTLSTVLLLLATFSLGVSFALVEKRISPYRIRSLLDNGSISVGQSVEIIAVINGAPEVSPEGLRFTVSVESIGANDKRQTASGVIALFLPTNAINPVELDQLHLRYAARLRVVTALKREDSFRNPGVSSFTEYLDRQGYDATAILKRPFLIERLNDERVFLPLAWLYEWRNKLEHQVALHFEPETAGILNAALLGNRYGLSRSAAERFRTGGTFHVLVISGLHVSFIAGLVFMVARRVTKNVPIQFIASVLLLWSYTLAVGAGVSVVRAAFMFTFVALAPLASRRAGSINALSASALFLLANRPSDLFNPSFQLTFLSVIAIVVIAWPLLERARSIGSWMPSRSTPYPPTVSRWLCSFAEILFWDERHWQRQLRQMSHQYKLFKSPVAITLNRYRLQPLVRAIFAAVTVSISVQLVLLPILIIYFHRLSFAAIVLNIGVSILMALVSVAAVAGLLLVQISSVAAAPFIQCADTIDWMMVHSVDPFVSLGIASVRVAQYSEASTALYVLYYLPMLVLTKCLFIWTPLSRSANATTSPHRLLKTIAISQVFLILIVTLHPFSAARGDGRLYVNFLDVGQGDSALIIFPDGSTLLLDGGGKPAFRRPANASDGQDFEPDSRPIGEAVVSEYLWHRGMDKIDYILATHADADHIDGLNDVAENFGLRAAIVGRQPASDPEFARFAQTMTKQSVPITLIGAGDTLGLGGTMVTVLWPVATSDGQAPSANNDSVVLRLSFGKRSFLFTGDMEKQAELSILSSGENLKADVVKVAHHGSRTSSTSQLVAAVQPRLAVISVGQTSIFGHPHKDVVERWSTSGAKVLTTGKCGTITVSTDGTDLRVETFVPC